VLCFLSESATCIPLDSLPGFGESGREKTHLMEGKSKASPLHGWKLKCNSHWSPWNFPQDTQTFKKKWIWLKVNWQKDYTEGFSRVKFTIKTFYFKFSWIFFTEYTHNFTIHNLKISLRGGKRGHRESIKLLRSKAHARKLRLKRVPKVFLLPLNAHDKS